MVLLGKMVKKPFPKDQKRATTDQRCCLAFIACLLGAAAFVAYAAYAGEARRLTRGFQWDGLLCGVDDKVWDKPFLYYCGSPERIGDYPVTLNFQSPICVADCPTATDLQLQCLMAATVLPNNSASATTCPGGNCSKVVRTVRFDMVQTIEYQQSYPTETFRGRFCLPLDQTGSTIRDDFIYGHILGANRFQRLLGSLVHGWPVVLLAAVLAGLLGYLYLYCMKLFAGCTIFVTMCLAAFASTCAGIFFLLALFFDASDDSGYYEKLNPIMRSFWGVEAKFYSMLLGLVLTAYGVALAYSTRRILPKIDEAVGLVQAACDCIYAPHYDLLLEPLVKACLLLMQVLLAGAGMALISSVGYVDGGSIIVNGMAYDALLTEFRWYPGWPLAVLAYSLVCLWLWGVMLGRFHFAVSYATCLWYFSAIQKTEDPLPGFVREAMQGGKKIPISVGGHAGGAKGFLKKDSSGNDYLVAPMGEKTPAGEQYYTPVHEVKVVPRFSCIEGSFVAFFHHLGSLALGSVVGGLTWPIRMLTLLWKALASRDAYDDDDHKKDVFYLLMSLLHQSYGPYGTGAYMDLVLNGKPFMQAAESHYALIDTSGGAVNFLFGSCHVYESIAVSAITVLVTVACFLLTDNLDLFSDPSNDTWYVADVFGLSCICSVVSASVAYSCVALFSHTCDTLLFVFAWARANGRLGMSNCPWAMRNILADELIAMEQEPVPNRFAPPAGPRMDNFWHAVRKFGPTGEALGTLMEMEPLVSDR